MLVGRIENSLNPNHLVCVQGLKLLRSLFDFEINRDADIFLKIYSQSAP
jgi:hypothetical protein